MRPLADRTRLAYIAELLAHQYPSCLVTKTSIPPELLCILNDRAAGNPKHIKEMLNAIIDANALEVLSNGRIIIKTNLFDIPVPRKLSSSVFQEYDQLDESLKIVLQVASVFEQGFTPKMIEETLSCHEATASHNLAGVPFVSLRTYL